MIESLLVANRGEIARRIIRTARRLGVRTVAVYSEADADLPYVREADMAVKLGSANPSQSYRNGQLVLDIAKRTKTQAIHPGYGFLSENAEFAGSVTANGLIWVGPPAPAIAAMGDKIQARNLMADAGVPVAPGTREPAPDRATALELAEAIGYPIMVKAAAGGGGMGMAVAPDATALATEFEKVRAFAERMFGSGDVLLERYFPTVRHVEVQILGLADGSVVALGERECSVQRRNQKVLEESPSPALNDQQRRDLLSAAVRAGEAVGYRNAGTVECLFDPASGNAYFLEMNTRLQVEHPVTETVFGLDLVEEQLRIASGLAPTFGAVPPEPRGHAIELRINAEDPKRFLPGPGAITRWVEPQGDGVRVDSGYAAGTTVTPHYDSLMAKLIVAGATRAEAIERAKAAVAGFEIVGPKNNLPFLAEVLEFPEFVSGAYDTGLVGRMRPAKTR
jgi:acetyl-CoA carboxylase, biotin carboxylase subunit